MDVIFPFCSHWDLCLLLWLFKYYGERFSNYISQLHQSSAFFVWSLTHDNQEILNSKVSLKICQFCSSLSLRAVSQEAHPQIPQRTETSKIQSLDSTLPLHMSIKNMITLAWSLQPRLPVVLKSPICSSVLASNRSSNTSPLTRLSHGLKNLSLMHLKRLQDCLKIAVLLFQQMWMPQQVNMVLPVVEVRRICQDLPLYQAGGSKHQPQGFV